MSGGHWNYMDSQLGDEIFGYRISFRNGLSGSDHDKNLSIAIKENPLEDAEISALVYDVFCLLHSYDWAISADTGEETYRRDVTEFKKRWLKRSRPTQIREMIDICTSQLRDELYKAFACDMEGETENGQGQQPQDR